MFNIQYSTVNKKGFGVNQNPFLFSLVFPVDNKTLQGSLKFILRFPVEYIS